MALSIKEKTFADEYIINHGNAYRAALKAGYADSTAKDAPKWLNPNMPFNPAKPYKPHYKAELAEYINKELDKLQSKKVASKEEVMEYLSSVMRGLSKSSVLCLSGDGCQKVILKPPDEKEKLDAAKTLAKIYGIVNNRVDVTATVPVIISGEKELEE